MKSKNLFGMFLICFMLTNTFLYFMPRATNDSMNHYEMSTDGVLEEPEFLLKASSTQKKPLNYSRIYQNATLLYRSFDTINFTINATGFTDVNYTIMQISFTNDTIKNYTMVAMGNDNFSRTYTPEYNAPLGVQNVSFLIYVKNFTLGNKTLLNNQTTFTNFTIKSNCMVGLNATEISRGDFLEGQVVIRENLNWNITIVDSENIGQQNISTLGNNIFQFLFQVDDKFTQANAYYHVKVNMTRIPDGRIVAEYFKFKVLNSLPVIITATVKFDPEPVFRTTTCSVKLNVSDFENNDNPLAMTATLNLEDPNGDDENYPMTNNDDGSFVSTFTIPATKPAGNYRANITVIDEHGGQTFYYKFIEIKNNPPSIQDYKINGLTRNESISINYGHDLVFTFNISDIEGITYVSISLFNEFNQWFNITQPYQTDLQITIRTVDLVQGKWYVYVHVIDSDGYKVGLDFDYGTAPQEIIIISDYFSSILPWLALLAGIALGVALGIILGNSLLKRKYKPQVESKLRRITSPKKKLVTPKKTTTKPSPTPKKTEPEKKPTKDSASSKKQPEKPLPQRKIKRRLK